MVNTKQSIEKVMSLRHLNAADIARKLNLSHSSVSGMLSRETLQVKRLIELSHVLKYNFFREIASKIEYKEPLIGTDIIQQQQVKHQHEIEQLKDEIKRLEIKVEVLEGVVEKAVGK